MADLPKENHKSKHQDTVNIDTEKLLTSVNQLSQVMEVMQNTIVRLKHQIDKPHNNKTETHTQPPVNSRAEKNSTANKAKVSKTNSATSNPPSITITKALAERKTTVLH